MNIYKVCVYAICKNEQNFVDRWMDSVSEADLIIVVDTGSTDDTVAKLRRRGAIVHEKVINPWRFDTARNIALSYVPNDVDICVSNDLDEVFTAGWRKKLEAAWKPMHTRAKYLFTWSFNADGTPNKQFPMEKIHRRHGFRWVHPVHEILEYNGTDEDKSVWVDGLILNHYPDVSKPRSSYLPLLEMSVKENPQNDRALFWLGREYMYHKKYSECIKTLKEHLNHTNAKWDEERSASMRFIAHCYDMQGDVQQAIRWLYKAIAECAYIREPYVALAKVGCKQSNWSMVYAMVQNALKINQNTGSYLVEAENWSSAPYDYGAISLYHLGLYDKALEYAKTAYHYNTADKRLKANLELIKNKVDGIGQKEVIK